jgi:hypothetical protein
LDFKLTKRGIGRPVTVPFPAVEGRGGLGEDDKPVFFVTEGMLALSSVPACARVGRKLANNAIRIKKYKKDMMHFFRVEFCY